MPTSAKTPDQRSDRYLGTSKWAPRLRHVKLTWQGPALRLASRASRPANELISVRDGNRRMPSRSA